MVSKYVALCVALVILYQCVGRTRSEDVRLVKRATVRACGRALSELLSFVCNGRYNGPKSGKRSNAQEDDAISNDDDVLGWNTEGVLKSDDEDTYAERIQRGIVDECCRQSCNFSTLRSYCGSE